MTNLAKPVSDDDRRWMQEADEARHKGLTTVQSAADGWGKSIGAILGGFALVSFLKGPEAIKDVPTGGGATIHVGILAIDPARWVIGLIFTAAALIILAIAFAAFAAQGTPVWMKVLDGPALRDSSERAEKDAIRRLRVSRILTLVGAALVFCAMALAWWATIDKLGRPQVARVTTSTGIVCGELRSRADGLIEVVVAGGPTSLVPPDATITADSGERRNTHEIGELRWVVEDQSQSSLSVRHSPD